MKRWFLCVLLTAVCTVSGEAQSLDLSDYVTQVRLNDSVQVSLYTPTLMRLRISSLPGERFPERYEIPFLIGHLEKWPAVAYRHWRDEGRDFVETASIRLTYTRQSGQWTVETRDGKAIYPSHGPVHGLFRDGYSVFDNASAFGEFNSNSRFSHWFYNPETGRYIDTYLEEDLIADTYFVYGPDYPSLFRQLNDLFGPEPLLPRKGYGFYQTQHLACKGSQQQLLDVAHRLRERKIPCDYLILDFEWGDGCDGDTEVDWGSRLDWSPHYTAPLSPQAMVDSLKAMHFDVLLIHHSAPDFPSRKHQSWTQNVYDWETWWRKFDEKLSIGVAGTWQDTRRNAITDCAIWQGQTDRFGQHRRVLFMGCRKMQALNPWDAYFTALPMNGLLGDRRYPFRWTGDCSFSWNELAWQIEAIANTHGSMKMANYISSDGVGANWQIQARWNQFSDFSPISRSHNPKPWSGNVSVKEFIAKIQITGRDTLTAPVGQSIADAPGETAEHSIRLHRKLRYRLLPYLYSAAHELYETGMPICRPLRLAYADDHFVSGNQWPTQYVFGPSLLVAPVTGDYQTMEIFLPKGSRWIDFWDETRYAGGGILRYDVSDVNKLPLFVQSGAIIPMGPEMQWIDPTGYDAPLYVHWYPEGASSYTLTEDDGVTLGYQSGRVSKIVMTGEAADERLIFTVHGAEGGFDGQPIRREMRVTVHGVKTEPGRVTVNGREVKDWKWEKAKGLLTIELVHDLKKDVTIEVM